MDYKIMINEFVGPMDLLLHLIKKSDINICEISIEEITKQYLDYINKMGELDLDIASEYLIMAAELIEIKSAMLLPKQELDSDEFEEDPKEQLIKRLIEYKKYKEMTEEFKQLEETRKQIYTKESNDLSEYKKEENLDLGEIDLDSLINAFSKFLERKDFEKPLTTKVTKREMSIGERGIEIKEVLKLKKKLNFEELFEEYNKEYIVITFLSILSLAKKQEIEIKQDNNFSNIILSLKGCE